MEPQCGSGHPRLDACAACGVSRKWTKMNLACVVGARPNFMKMAPLLRALAKYRHVHPTLIHTGQHYDANLSDVFFEELGMKRPDISLEVGSGTHAEQTAKVLHKCAATLESGPPGGGRYDRLVVVGDVNSTMAAALAAAKLQIPVAHVEAGLRSFDRSMPEEINRIVTDSISDMLLVSEPAGMDNLRREGHPEKHLHLTGNVMIDTLRWLLPGTRERTILRDLGVTPGKYGVVTLHRPANVDDAKTLTSLIDVLVEVSSRLPLVFPVHPRTQARIERFDLVKKIAAAPGFRLEGPLGYLDFLALTSQARVIVTDSGGLQEESTALGIPCLTMRSNTERPVTVERGSSILIGADTTKLQRHLEQVMAGEYKSSVCPENWDGHAAERIAQVLVADSS